MAAVAFLVGVALSRVVEPGLAVDYVTLGGDTPAVRVAPRAAPLRGPRPVVLLAHGVSASKETLFRLSEALAAAGFACYAIDLPGHGASPLTFGASNERAIGAVARSLPSGVRVFVGHSMGAYAGAGAVRDGLLAPELFIALGAVPDLGDHAPPLLLLAGRLEEAVPVASLEAARERSAATLVLSRWSDHVLEPYDPLLIAAAVEAARDAVSRDSLEPGAPPSGELTRSRFRLVGLVVALLSALVLGDRTTDLVPRLAIARGAVVSLWVIAALALAGVTWIGASPVARRLPVQALLALVLVGGLFLVRKLRLPRIWPPAVLAATGALVCAVGGAGFLALLAAILAGVLAAAALVAWIAARRGSPRDGDLAFAVFAAYAIGQWIPRLL